MTGKRAVPPALLNHEEQAAARDLNNRLLTWSSDLVPAVCPVYRIDERDKPDLVGSSVLLRFGPRSFLVTAAHVMDRRRPGPLYVAGAREDLVELSGTFYETHMPAEGRKRDQFDLAVFPLTDSQVVDFGPCRYLGRADLAPDEAVDTTPIYGTRYMLLGYPASQQPRRIQDDLTPRHRATTACPKHPTDYASRGLDPRHHVLLEYERESMFNTVGRNTAPDPHGMSGGGCWSVDLFGVRHLACPKLVSILIEYHDAPHHTVTSTRVGLCLDVIGDYFPELSPKLRLPKPI